MIVRSIYNTLYIYILSYILKYVRTILYYLFQLQIKKITIIKEYYTKIVAIVVLQFFCVFCLLGEAVAIKADRERLWPPLNEEQPSIYEETGARDTRQRHCNADMLLGMVVLGTIGYTLGCLLSVYGPLSECNSHTGDMGIHAIHGQLITSLNTMMTSAGTNVSSVLNNTTNVMNSNSSFLETIVTNATSTVTSIAASAAENFTTNASFIAETTLSPTTNILDIVNSSVTNAMAMVNSTLESVTTSVGQHVFNLTEWLQHHIHKNSTPFCPSFSKCCYKVPEVYFAPHATPGAVLPLNSTDLPPHMMCIDNNSTHLLQAKGPGIIEPDIITSAITTTTTSVVTRAVGCVNSISSIVGGGLSGALLGSMVGVAVGCILSSIWPPSLFSRLKNKFQGINPLKEDPEVPQEEKLQLVVMEISGGGGHENKVLDEESVGGIEGRIQPDPQNTEHQNSDSETEEQSDGGGGNQQMQVVVMVHNPQQMDLAQGYSPEGQISSLQSMQGILLGASEQVLTNLKLLTLKASESRYENSGWYSTSTIKRHFQPTGPMITPTMIKTLFSSTRMFSSADIYSSNLEKKCRSGKIGIITEVTPKINVGLVYNHYKDTFKQHVGIPLGSAVGSVKAKTDTESFFTVLSLNPNKPGFTGHLATCYGWGRLKNIRQVAYNGVEVSTKGKPNISLTGGLLQLGYHIPFSKKLSIIPFVESMFSRVRWKSYKEQSGYLPCSIGRNREKLWEHSIGLRNHWKFTEGSQLQAWVSNIFGHREVTNITLQPIHHSMDFHKLSVPSIKGSYSRVELGIMYELGIKDFFKLGLNGKVQFATLHKPCNQHIMASFQYMY